MLIPISGQTDVQVETTGRVKILDFTPSDTPREKSIKLCSTKYAKMWLSPAGVNRTIKICMPAKAPQAAFEKEMDMLYEIYNLNNI